MAKYGEYNFGEEVFFQKNYENAYSEAYEQTGITVDFKKMYNDNGVEIPTPLSQKLNWLAAETTSEQTQGDDNTEVVPGE